MKGRGRVVNTPPSYVGGHGSKLGPETVFSEGVSGSPQFLPTNAGTVP
jgi:hypothetical protein